MISILLSLGMLITITVYTWITWQSWKDLKRRRLVYPALRKVMFDSEIHRERTALGVRIVHIVQSEDMEELLRFYLGMSQEEFEKFIQATLDKVEKRKKDDRARSTG